MREWRLFHHQGRLQVAGSSAPVSGEVELRSENPLARLYARLGDAAAAASGRPSAALLALLGLNLALAALLAPLGWAATGDQALFFRELMPGTWLSFGELVLVSAIAWRAHELDRPGSQPLGGIRRLRRYDDFWALSAGVFLVLAIDEITQATLFLSKWMKDALHVSAPGAFVDVDSAVLVLLFSACALLLARRALVLFRHPRALALLVVAGLLGAGSQAIDSLVPVSEWEMVVEESLKLASAAFFVGGYLTALRDLIARSPAIRG